SHTMRPHALRDRLTDTLINPMTLGHEKEPTKRQTDLTVNHVTPLQQGMYRPISRSEQPFFWLPQRTRNEPNLTFAFDDTIVMNIQHPMRKHTPRPRTGLLPMLKKPNLGRDPLQIRNGREKRPLTHPVRTRFALDPLLRLRPQRLSPLAFDLLTALQ